VSDHPSPWGFDRSYWLCRCQGFRVADEHGPLGRVDGVLFHSRLDRPDCIVVRAGPRRRFQVPVEEVVSIAPNDSLLVVAGVRRERPSLLDDLRRRLSERRRTRTEPSAPVDR
jgi:hypothetical protein